jgi:DNA-binding CsgD family transcriptional regulator
MLLARHRNVDAIFESLRAAADELLQAEETRGDTPRPRVGTRITDPGDGAFWSVHVVRTRQDWPIAVAVNDGARTARADGLLRERLTRRELEVAALVAEGNPAKDIATALSISVHTARRHTEQVFRKLRVHSRAELTHVVMRGGDIRTLSAQVGAGSAFEGAA